MAVDITIDFALSH